MRSNPVWSILKLVAIAIPLVAANVGPATAQSDGRYIQASFVYNYARYYAPYAIQASAAYLPLDEFNARRATQDADGYGADVNYAVQTIFPDEKVKPRAREAFKRWRYQFGSDSYLTCIDPTDADCLAAYNNRGWSFSGGPAFQVWARARSAKVASGACSEVSIAFRGTVGTSLGDWLSNADRFGSPYDDYYHQLRRNVDAIIKSVQNLDCYKRAAVKPQIVSTGHSLGGGLAQLAALATKLKGPRISKVFAFDPSPVTGAHLVDQSLRESNADGLTIDRIYQEGEVLSYVRSAAQQYPSAKSKCNPYVRTVKVDALPPGSPIQLHGMTGMSTQLVQLSYNGETQLAYEAPPGGCRDIRYRAPATDQDEVLVSSVSQRQTLLAAVRKKLRGGSQLAGSSSLGRQWTQALQRANSREVFAQVGGAVAFEPLQRAE
ncbi:DUF2974 domain-containing protein [Bradyrhizobium viridifuturi]|nr:MULTISPECIES: DUF2974 domain-containing protein [Bradyrhizobium]ERF83986.1 MAG: hypothetical protein C207_02773 [Bradyrhizobium sp. DFCI-1]OYU63672.1 MAG: hypothetical protein CFE30_04175 [Bradyrhizobium sp. PARBB1]PSO27907.1 DUF2974 domain-containing protein [Bradyrhizobium sp. MOS004]QRI69067.1 DUF2974 domain-containing protein [Bradyrhizobium sp. PSBB068]MBR1019348.1 DUF2974 domain-containing protein [Bradyrhizobium viridifuturi]